MPLDKDTERLLRRTARLALSWRERRDKHIRDALDNGAGVREVARATDLHHSTISNIQTPKKRSSP